MPSLEMAALFPVPVEIARKTPSSGAHTTSRSVVSVEGVLDVQLMPSGDVIARLAPVVAATAQKSPSWGDQHTLAHICEIAVRAVQVIPFGDVITEEAAAADCATAQKS